MAKPSRDNNILLGNVYGSSSVYGNYEVYLCWNDTTRSGTTVTMHDVVIWMERQGTGYTKNRIAYMAGIGGPHNNLVDNGTAHPAHSNSPAEITLSLGNPTTSTISTSFEFEVWMLSTGWSSDWNNAQGNGEQRWTAAIECPAANPTYVTNPSVVGRTETSITINRGSTDIGGTYYYRIEAGSWKSFSATTATISNLNPNTSYTIETKCIANGLNSYTNPEIQAMTYQYPYILSIEKNNIQVGQTQKVYIYNPLKHNVNVYMKKDTQSGYTIIQQTTSSTELSFVVSATEASAAIGDTTDVFGVGVYFVTYNNNPVIAEKIGSFELLSSLCRPVWSPTITPTNLIKYKDHNATAVGISQNDQVLIQKFSQVAYTIDYNLNPAISNFNSSIEEYSFSVNGGAWRTFTSASGEYFNSNITVPENAILVTIAVRAKDKRGFYSPSQTRQINTMQYNAPTGAILANRKGGFGTEAALIITPNWAINQSTNEGTAKYRYQKDNESFSSYQTTENFNSEITIIDCDNDSTYTFEVILTDNFGISSITLIDSFGPGTPILFIDEEQIGIGVNTFPEGPGVWTTGGFYEDSHKVPIFILDDVEPEPIPGKTIIWIDTSEE